MRKVGLIAIAWFVALAAACSDDTGGPPMPGPGEQCYTAFGCTMGYLCSNDGVCVQRGAPGAYDQGDDCASTHDCRMDLICTSQQKCAFPGIGQLGCDLVDVDSMVSIQQARQETGPEQVLAGNLNPVEGLRNSRPEAIAEALAECQRQAGPRWVVAAGCEVPRDTPWENVEAMRDFARRHSAY